MPVVGCDQLTTGRPPAGTGLVGANTIPVTTIGSSLIPKDVYMTRHACDSGNGAFMVSKRMIVPGALAGIEDGVS
ncbi:unannotated protein [freshwater metagenome]|uniref:Unannotated protein n=1 Tax=freshwater metagenome TaxID=449393 RepID=A0A6J6HXH7_9ZZZZ